MPSGIAVGYLFPIVDGKPKKRLLYRTNFQWLVLECHSDMHKYQVIGIFLRKKDAKLFKRFLKKRDRK